MSIRSWRADVFEALDDAGMSDMALRWLSCSEQPLTRLRPRKDVVLPDGTQRIYVCTGDHRHDAEIYHQSCDLRICPECSRRHAARLVARYLPKMLELAHSHHHTYRFRHIMFSSPYSLEDEEIRKKYLKGFKLVESVMGALMSRRSGAWRDDQGFLVTAEFGEEGRKLHYHVIHWGMYLNQADLASAWRDATGGDAQVVWVKGFPYRGLTIEETLREVLKYAVKFYSQDPSTGEIKAIPAQLVPVLAKVLDKTRRVRSYGVFYGLPEPDPQPHTCKECGMLMIDIPVSYWDAYCQTGFLPLEWRNVSEQRSLNLKPADKSSRRFTGPPPPEAKNRSVSQRPLPGMANLVKYIHGW